MTFVLTRLNIFVRTHVVAGGWGKRSLIDVESCSYYGTIYGTYLPTMLLTIPYFLFYILYHRPGDKRQLKAQDVTAKFVGLDILRMVPKNILICIKLT